MVKDMEMFLCFVCDVIRKDHNGPIGEVSITVGLAESSLPIFKLHLKGGQDQIPMPASSVSFVGVEIHPNEIGYAIARKREIPAPGTLPCPVRNKITLESSDEIGFTPLSS
jgi:hypothetical protein